MLDYRIETFLALCQIKNYTKTAQLLHITQPAVTQHIQYLEDYYNTKLFIYKGKSLTLTREGEKLKEQILALKVNSDKIKLNMLSHESTSVSLNFGATKTIGEYVLSPILSKLLNKKNKYKISLLVDNTEILLSKLRSGLIDFALIEGSFEKCKYDSLIFSKENFIAVASKDLKINSNVTFSDLKNIPLIIREKGSGSREILEQILQEQNLLIDDFVSVIEIGNLNLIKSLVKNNLGITFIYKAAVLDELKDGSLKEIKIDNFDIIREFNFVFLKDNLNKEFYINYYNLFKSLLK